MKRLSVFIPACLAAMLCAGCLDFLTSNTAPSSVTASTQTMTGSWASVSSATALTNTCTDFHWTITALSGATGSGAFTAKCLGNLPVTGMAQGTLSDTTVTWSATAVGTTSAGLSCPISLTGTASFDGTQFRIPFTGTTCLGPVSGTEILRKT